MAEVDMMQTGEARSGRMVHALAAIGCVIAAGAIANAATLPNIPTWHAGLNKPWFNPPNGVFAPVWSVLYAAMAFAFYRILRSAPAMPGRTQAIGLFMAQLAFNAGWSVVFFGLHSLAGGFAVIIVLIALVAATMAAFFRIDAIAGWCFAPYLAWVCFAAVLNAAFWRLN